MTTLLIIYYNTHYTLHTAHYTLTTTHYRLHTTHYTLYTTHYTLHTTDYTLHTTHYTLHSNTSSGVLKMFLEVQKPNPVITGQSIKSAASRHFLSHQSVLMATWQNIQNIQQFINIYRLGPISFLNISN